MTAISVLMPTYNQLEYLTESVNSVLNQTFSDFEFIIIDDCSTDRTIEYLERCAKLDKRIRVLSNNINLGVSNSLNLGLSIATGKYIARMDADDISFINRFEYQINYLNAHPECGVLGTETCFINLDGSKSDQPAWIKPIEHNVIVWNLLYSTPLCHPTTMIRHDILKNIGGYTTTHPNEDMDLWTRLAFHTSFNNLENTLLYYRMPHDVHRKKLEAWIPHIQNVSRSYVERILEKKVDFKLIQLIIDTNFGLSAKRSYEAKDLFQASLLLEEVYEKMKLIGMLEKKNLSQVEKIRYKQTQLIISLMS
jgi:glycosyltransferase involved in cell wall biosynthesis